MQSSEKSVLCKHIQSSKHVTGKKCLSLEGAREKKISDMLKSYDNTVHPIGETLLSLYVFFR